MTAWLLPPSNPTLANHEVHIWKADLHCTEVELQHLSTLLAPDEQQRAARFYFEKDRHQYCVARGLLRLILSVYLSEHPSSLQFAYSPYGKPALQSRPHDDPLQFNVSHSHGIALYAVAQQDKVGIDVEYLRADFGWREIVEHYFSEREIQMLSQVPQSQQQQAFFDGWTRKEAYIKARGQGLSIPLKQFDVSLAPGEPAALLHAQEDRDPTQWTIHALHPGENYAGAVAIQGRNPILRYWQTSPQAWDLDLAYRGQQQSR
jgi:4'-phosphopantetheinyl transferase